MTFNELRYLVAIAQEKSFGRAAQRCFVSQPALSVAIQKLEEELGTQLFERGKAEVTVTPVGERIVEQAQKVLEAGQTVFSAGLDTEPLRELHQMIFLPIEARDAVLMAVDGDVDLSHGSSFTARARR